MDDFANVVGTNVKRRKPKDEEGWTLAGSGAPRAPDPTPDGCRSWAAADGKFWGTQQSFERLPVGVYRMDLSDRLGALFIQQQNDTDALVELPDSASAGIVSEIKQFKTLRGKFKEYGFLYKRGILLWGPPGSGKTCTLQFIMKLLMQEHDGVAVLLDHPGIAATCLQSLRRIEPERQVVGVLEDMDSLCERFGESEYLSLLDGESQVDNVVYLATTNYPERLDKRFVDRPSRFDTIRYVGMPSAAARSVYLKTKAPQLEGETLAKYVSNSDGYSIAHLRELIILTHCFGVSLKDACERLNATRIRPPSSTQAPDRPVFGFGGGA